MSQAAPAPQTQTVKVAKPFGWNDRIGYALGDTGNNLTFNVVSTFLMIFYTNIYGLPGAMVGMLFLAARLIDAFVDVGVGRLADNSPLGPKGRFTPWVIRMKYPLAVAAIVLFIPGVSHFPMWARTTYAFVTYLIFGICYSFVNIPYGSMASAISDDPDHKTSLSTFRSVGAAVGSAIVSYVLPLIMYVGGSKHINGMRFFIGASIFALLGTCAYVGLTRLTTERIRVEKTEPVPIGKMLRDMVHNKALIALVFIDIVVVINQNLSGTTLTYLFNDYFQNKAAMSTALIFNFTTVILVAPFAQTLVRRFGRRESALTALLVAGVIYGALFLSHTHSYKVFLVGLFFGSLGVGVFNLMVWAFITDVIDAHEVLMGEREDGIVYGVNSFARKFAQAIGGLVGGTMISMIGYKSSTTGGTTQAASVVGRIYSLATLIPTVSCFLAALIMLFFYPLTKKKVLENAAILRGRRATVPDPERAGA